MKLKISENSWMEVKYAHSQSGEGRVPSIWKAGVRCSVLRWILYFVILSLYIFHSFNYYTKCIIGQPVYGGLNKNMNLL